jgi:adenylate kinase family enzyme
LLRESGLDVNQIDFAADETVIKLVEPELKQCADEMQGWVLDGFPRTNQQASWLKEKHIVPSQDFLMNMPQDMINEINDSLHQSVLDAKLKLHFRHGLAALEAYMDNLKQIDISYGEEDEVWAEIDAELKLRPYSKAPKRAPRTVLLGPPGSQNKTYAERLADQLGAVFVDGDALQKGLPPEYLSEVVFERLSQNDCQQYGWVLTNYPQTVEQAEMLKDGSFSPIRTVLLECSMETSVRQISSGFVDPVTGTVWDRPPKDEVIRKRLKRNDFDLPEYVQVRYQKFMSEIDHIFSIISEGGNGAKVNVEGDSREVSDIIAEFVERPLSFELLNV